MITDSNRLIYVMRPDGELNISHYFGALQELRELQYQYQSILFIADVQQLTTNPIAKIDYQERIENIVRDCILCGIDPSQTIICIESQIAELAEIHQLISAITPLGWLERVQNYKEVIDEIDHTELSTFGLLGLPLLYSAAVLGFNAMQVLEDNEYIAYIELSREIARRFNHLYGRESGFEEKAYQSINKLGEKKSDLYLKLLTKFQQDGDEEAEEQAKFLLEDAHNLAFGDKNRLIAFLENKSRVYLNEPKLLPLETKVLGTDGEYMDNTCDNVITLHETKESLNGKIRLMPSDPARVRLTDPGNPKLCPVWQLHKFYTPEQKQAQLNQSCTSATIGCSDCKQIIEQNILNLQHTLHDKYGEICNDNISIKKIIADNCESASKIVCDTLKSLKEAVCFTY